MASISSIARALAILGIKKTTGGGGGGTLSSNPAQPLGVAALAGATGQYSDAGHVHQYPTPAQINALGLPCPWVPTTNVATLPGGSTVNLPANSAPTGDNAFYAVSGGTLLLPLNLAGGGTLTTVNTNDIVYWTGNGWAVLFASANGTTGTNVLKGDGNGGIANAVLGVDVGAPPVYQCAVPIGHTSFGSIGPNGWLTIPSAYAFVSSQGTYGYYGYQGIWLWLPSGAINKTSLPGFYWVQMSTTGVMNGTLAGGTAYTNGVYTNVALTGGTGSAALANITVAGGVVTKVAFTHHGTGYAVNDVLSAPAASIGGTGSGFTYTVTLLDAYNTSTGLTTLTITTAGSGYVNGTYTNVPLVNNTGAGVAAQATITVQGGAVVAVQVTCQGSGYSATAGSNSLTAAAADLGGSGTSLALTVATIGAGPMTGIVYNNMYVPGNNTGANSVGNPSVQPPSPPTPFVGTQGTTFGAPVSGQNALVLTSTKVPGGYLGNNGRVESKFVHQAMVTAGIVKVMGVGLSATATASPSYIGGQSNVSNGARTGMNAIFLNRGNAAYQWAPSQDPAPNGGFTESRTTINTAADWWLKSYCYINVAAGTGLWNTPGVLTPGSGYTNGSYTNVALTGGGGSGATANITVSGGQITSVVLTNPGTGYTTASTVGASNASLGGGSGTGFAYWLNGGIIAPGSGYTNGTYANVPLTGGGGSGALATITVAGGIVTNVLVTSPGTGYVAANVLSASTTFLGAGSGFTYTLGTQLCMADWNVQEYLIITAYPQP